MKLATGAFKETFGPYATGIGAAFNAFTTKKDVSPLPIPRIPANFLQGGSLLEFDAQGEYSSLTGATMGLGLYLGTFLDDATVPAIVTDIVLASITTGTTPAAWYWHMHGKYRITKTGSAGSMTGGCILDLGTSISALTSTVLPITAAARVVAINTTVDNRVGVSGSWGASSASNQIITYSVDVAHLN